MNELLQNRFNTGEADNILFAPSLKITFQEANELCPLCLNLSRSDINLYVKRIQALFSITRMDDPSIEWILQEYCSSSPKTAEVAVEILGGLNSHLSDERFKVLAKTVLGCIKTGRVNQDKQSHSNPFLKKFPLDFQNRYMNPELKRWFLLECIKIDSEATILHTLIDTPISNKPSPWEVNSLKDLEALDLPLSTKLWTIPALPTDKEKIDLLESFLFDEESGRESQIKVFLKFFPEFGITEPSALMQLIQSCLKQFQDTHFFIRYHLHELPLKLLSIDDRQALLLQLAEHYLSQLMDYTFSAFGFDWSDPVQLKILDALIPHIANSRLNYDLAKQRSMTTWGLDPQNPLQNDYLKKMFVAFTQSGSNTAFDLYLYGNKINFDIRNSEANLAFIREHILPITAPEHLWIILENLENYKLTVTKDFALIKPLLLKYFRHVASSLNEIASEIDNVDPTNSSTIYGETEQLKKIFSALSLDPQNDDHKLLLLEMVNYLEPEILILLLPLFPLNKIADEAQLKQLNQSWLQKPSHLGVNPTLLKAILPESEFQIWMKIHPLTQFYATLKEFTQAFRSMSHIEVTKLLDLIEQIGKFLGCSSELEHWINDQEIEELVQRIVDWKKQLEGSTLPFPEELLELYQRLGNIISLMKGLLIGSSCILRAFPEDHLKRIKGLASSLNALEKLYTHDQAEEIAVWKALSSHIHEVSFDFSSFPNYRYGQNGIYPLFQLILSEDLTTRNKQLEILKNGLFRQEKAMDRHLIREIANLLLLIAKISPAVPTLNQSIGNIFVKVIQEEKNPQILIKKLSQKIIELRLLLSVSTETKELEELAQDLARLGCSTKIQEILTTNFGIKTKDPTLFYEKFFSLFMTWKDPSLLFKYVKRLKQIAPEQIQVVNAWIEAVVEGPKALLELRMHNPLNQAHFNLLTAKDALKNWDVDLQLEEAIRDRILDVKPLDIQATQAELMQCIHHLKIDFKKTSEAFPKETFNELLPFLHWLNENRVKKPNHYPEAIKALKMIAKLTAPFNLSSTYIFQTLNQLSAQLIAVKNENAGLIPHEPLEALNSLITRLVKTYEQTQNPQLQLSVQITHDPETMFTMGEYVEGSCQSINSPGVQNIGLIGYCSHGKNKVIAVKDRENNLLARALIKLVVDNKGTGVILLQPVYLNQKCKIEREKITPLIFSLAHQFARLNEMPLVLPSEIYKDTLKQSKVPYHLCIRELKSLRGLSRYEYDDVQGGLMSAAALNYTTKGLLEI